MTGQAGGVVNTAFQILTDSGVNLADSARIDVQSALINNIENSNNTLEQKVKEYNRKAKIFNKQIDIKDKIDNIVQNIENKIDKNENELLNIEKIMINKNKLIEINEESMKQKEIYIHSFQMFFVLLFLLIFPFIAYISKSISQLTLMSIIVLLIVIYIIYLIWYINRRSVKRFRDEKDTKFNKGVYYVKKKLNELDDNLSTYASSILNQDCGCEEKDTDTDIDDSNDANFVTTTGGLVQRINTNLYYDDGTGPKEQIIREPRARKGDNFMIDWESGRNYGSSDCKSGKNLYFNPDPRWPNTGLPLGSRLVDNISSKCKEQLPPRNFIEDIYSSIMKESIPRDKLEYYETRFSINNDNDRKNFVTYLFSTDRFKAKFKNPMNWVRVNDKPYVEQNIYKSITSGL
jgi:hypothetical protein